MFYVLWIAQLSVSVSLHKNDNGECEPKAKKLKCQKNADADNNKAADDPLKCQGKESQEKVKLGNRKDVTDEKAIEEKASGDQKLGEKQKSSDLKSAEEGQLTSAAKLNASKNSNELLNFMENELVCSICQDILHNAVR